MKKTILVLLTLMSVSGYAASAKTVKVCVTTSGWCKSHYGLNVPFGSPCACKVTYGYIHGKAEDMDANSYWEAISNTAEKSEAANGSSQSKSSGSVGQQ